MGYQVASKKFSYSRIGCFEECKQKYHLRYVKGIVVDPATQVLSDVTAKGLAFHEFAEHYETSWDEERINKEMRSYEEQYKEGAAYFPLDDKVRKLIDFYKVIVEPFTKTGKVEKETWLNGIIKGEAFCGAIDLLITHGDGTYHIIDYKSAKTATASNYKGQLLLYAYMLAMEKEIPMENIDKKITLSVFFPFCKEETYKKCLKSIKYTSQDVLDNLEKITSSVDKINTKDWSTHNSLDVSPTSTCSWCDYIGHPEYCPIMYKAGWRVKRGTKFILKDK